ncbi:pilus assembly protein [Comamonas sp. Tr-654]|uniref:pilus assembly protein n=1 Tax=Comamonas sp. Tr-654 TaxID=2608341 RepID=UPI001420E287|nr:pilus assembly protein [Comamonas sp. Tr-654]NIF86053.1 pilus assembly protein [Comamonas sp. Tr-654]
MHISPSLTNQGRQQGAAAVLMLLLITAVVALAAYGTDSTRTTAGAAQLKRATDAAALAAAQAYAANSSANIQAIAEKYVNANLGMDFSQTGRQLRITTEAFSYGSNADPAVRVKATFEASTLLQGSGPQDVGVQSAAAALQKTLEVALALPNTLSEDAGNLQALRRLGKTFARDLIEGRDSAYLSLVPYSQSVNVYDANQPNRIRQWALAGALTPVELTSLFRSGYASLADNRIPDRRANLLCVYRGLNMGENYFWTQGPAGQYQIHYRHDLPINGSPGAPPISWRGPNPDFGQATGVNDTRWMTADRGCPHAALLPLTNDLNKINDRLDIMSTRFNTNYAIALGWAAAALSPAFQGGAGWGLNDELPRKFQPDGGNSYKAIVFLVNSTDMLWFDTDSYNSYVGKPTNGCPANGSECRDEGIITRRFANLCSSLRDKEVRVFFITVGNDEAKDDDGDQVASASAFRRIAGAGLQNCAVKSTDLTYYNGRDFATAEGRFEERLEQIVTEVRQASSYVKLIE